MNRFGHINLQCFGGRLCGGSPQFPLFFQNHRAADADGVFDIGCRLLGAELLLLAGCHVLYGAHALGKLILAQQHRKGNPQLVGIGHLLLEFLLLAVQLHPQSGAAQGGEEEQPASGEGGQSPGTEQGTQVPQPPAEEPPAEEPVQPAQSGDAEPQAGGEELPPETP